MIKQAVEMPAMLRDRAGGLLDGGDGGDDGGAGQDSGGQKERAGVLFVPGLERAGDESRGYLSISGRESRIWVPWALAF